MPDFSSDGYRIAYLDEGPREGEPIVLVHGFGSNADVNWVYTGWVDLLVKDGRRVVAIDNRGHGRSEGRYDPALYNSKTFMAEDVRRLMDHLGIARADIMGYSMGAWISAHFAIAHPIRARSVIFGGLAMAMVNGLAGQETIAKGLEADSDDAVTSPKARAYRQFGKQTKSDLKALAACMRGSRQPVAEADIGRLDMPVLIAVGTKDDVAGSPEELAALIPHAEILPIPDRDHMVAVGDKVYKQGVLAFLGRRP
ncbi:alpha/beta fold hydrolase [Methyloraptor flagellatus]|jgi:pimeloyl-ACP methyl ester carboxylesterase|uniref:Alpha/beta hydrolase n=1 Tax=Methyloraptor flagellatus TaxID=3162530 RepID=A0AAU7XDJ4_9HYPH